MKLQANIKADCKYLLAYRERPMKKRWIYIIGAAILLGGITGCSKTGSMEKETQIYITEKTEQTETTNQTITYQSEEQAAETQQSETQIQDEAISSQSAEAFAKAVRQQILAYDWNGLSEKIMYPITIGDTTYQTKEEFAAEEFTFDDSFRKALEEETCENMFSNWQGIMMGENGQVWISEVLNEDLSSQGFQVSGINGLLNEKAAEARKKQWTMEQVIELANQPKDSLALTEELRKYWIHHPASDLDESILAYGTDYSLWYEEEEYLLHIAYSKKRKELDSVTLRRLNDREVIILYFEESAYREIHQADGAEVNAFLKQHQQISDYFTAELPANLTAGSFLAELGYGGSYLISSKEEDNAYIEDLTAYVDKEMIPNEWYSIGGMCINSVYEVEWENGKISSIPIYSNHISPIGEGESLEGCEVPAYLELMECDLYTAASLTEAENKYGEIPREKQTSRIWYVYFAKPESKEVYTIWLNADLYSKEEIIEFAESVRFTEKAFAE